MASILNTDISDLVTQWGDRVNFNEGYAQQRVAEARQAGRDAYSLGLDKSVARDSYFESRDQRFVEAKEFLAGDSAAQVADSEISDVEPDSIGEVMDGEDTLGMESVVANETEDLVSGGGDFHGSEATYIDQWVADDMNEAMDNGTFEHLDAGGAFDYFHDAGQ